MLLGFFADAVYGIRATLQLWSKNKLRHRRRQSGIGEQAVQINIQTDGFEDGADSLKRQDVLIRIAPDFLRQQGRDLFRCGRLEDGFLLRRADGQTVCRRLPEMTRQLHAGGPSTFPPG